MVLAGFTVGATTGARSRDWRKVKTTAWRTRHLPARQASMEAGPGPCRGTWSGGPTPQLGASGTAGAARHPTLRDQHPRTVGRAPPLVAPAQTGKMSVT